MLTKKLCRFSAIRTYLLVFGILLGLSAACLAQESDEPTPPEILAQAMQMLRTEQYDEAIDLLYVYLDAVEKSKMRRVLEIAQDTRYKLATLLISKDRKGEAIDVLETYVSLQPAKHIRKARKMLVACYFDEEKYAECLPAITNALYYNEHPIVYEEEKKSAFDRERQDAFLDEGEKEEPDLPYSADELEMLNFTMGECYFNLGQMEACLEPFTYVVDRTKNEQRKGYSIMQMINALIEIQGFDRIIDWVPALYKTPARFDIRVNLALLRAAAALFETGEYDSALPLYRMILPREELIEYQEKKIKQMRIDAGLPPEFGEELTSDEALLFGTADAEREMDDSSSAMTLAAGVRLVEDDEKQEKKMEQPAEVLELQMLLETLKGMAPYEDYVDFQMAQLYKNVDRYWEAIKFYDTVYAAEDAGDIGERSIYEAVSVLINNLSLREDAEKRAFSYLESHHTGRYPRLVAYVLTSYYQRNRAWKDVKNIRPYIEQIERTNDVLLVKYDTELYFMQGVADLMLQHYSNAVERFQYVMDEFPDTDQEANSLFWCGFSYLCLDQHEKAYDCFERYTRDFANLDPDKSMLDEAYYQGGICLFGLDRLDEAKDRFSYVIDTYGTNSTVYPDSCNMRGDILGSLGGTNLDLAIQDYKNSFANATKATQATYATFKMCDIFKADEHYYGLDYVLEAVNLYLAKWGDRGADIAKALFWLGRAEIQRGRYEAAAESYMQAVIDYGGDLRQDGVDMMIPELVKICTVFLSEDQAEVIKERLRIAMESTDNQVLKLRLRVTLAKFDDSVVELGKKLLKELPDLNNASPPVLSAICEASFELNDYSRSAELLRTFKYKFEDSDYMRSAYKLRASGQIINGDLDGALETVIAAQEEYGTDRTVSWAQLMKAQTLLSQSQLFSSDDPLTQDKLKEAAKLQLQMQQGKLLAINEQLTQLQNKSEKMDDSRLLAEKGELDEKISNLQRAVEGKSGETNVRALLARCTLDEAREENKNVMSVPEWRGEPFAQATYQLGEVEEEAGNLLEAHGYYQRAYFQYKGLGEWCAKGYLAAANVLKKLSEDPSLDSEQRSEYEDARISTLKAMLLDEYANESPQAQEARDILGPTVVAGIETLIASGVETNIEVIVESKKADPDKVEPSDKNTNSATEGNA